MDDILSGFENLKISAFSKYCKLTGNINNVTIGPNSSILQKNETKIVAPKPTPKKSSKTEKPSPKKESLEFNQALKEFEAQRREKLQEANVDRFNKFENFTKRQKEEKQNEWLLKQQAFIQSMQDNEKNILQTLNQVDANKSDCNEKLIRHYQDMIQRKMQYEQQLEKNKERQRVLNENIENIKKCQIEFRNVYQEIIATIKSFSSGEELRKALGDNFKLLKALPEALDEVITKCKTYNVDEEQYLKAASILNQVKNLKTSIEETINKINAKKLEEQAKAQLPPIKENVALDSTQKSSSKPTLSNLEQCVSVSNLKKYLEIRQFSSQYSSLFKELLADEQQKQFKFDCKKAVNIPVNALSAVNPEHLKDKYIKLNSLLSGKTVAVADKQINASRHPQGIPFCMDLLAKKFVLQGDLMISSNPEAAFCYATIIVSLWNDFPEFGKLLLGYFYTQCPYLVPFYIPKTEEQSNEEYYTSLGYRYVDGQIEKQDKFLKRMTGILRLYFAILIAKPRRGQEKNPHNIKNAWTFLVSLLKLDPQLDITATALHIFLETVGFEMEAVYGAAFKKLLRIIMEQYMPVLKNIDSGGPVTRLEVLLQDYRKKGQFDKPHGTLPYNFW